MPDELLRVESLTIHYAVFANFFQRLLGGGQRYVHAVDGISFAIRRGEIFGLVGESGCGKSTVGRALLGLVRPTSGQIWLDGRDLAKVPRGGLRRLREDVQIVYQDPQAALSPSLSIGDAIGDVVRAHWDRIREVEAETTKLGSRADAHAVPQIVLRVLEEVGLRPGDQFFGKLPSELSGGQMQRVLIARALVLRPRLLVADEPVALLDMSIRARVLDLLLDLRSRYGLTYLFITHDLATAKLICDRIAIMYLGRIVEQGKAQEVYADPKHPYTQALLQAVPSPRPALRRKKVLPKGEVPSAVDPPTGCRFHPRCPVAREDCGWEPRDFLALLEQRDVEVRLAERDRSLLGPISEIVLDGPEVRIPLQGKDVHAMIGHLEGMKPTAEAMFRAVESIETLPDGVAIRFRKPADIVPRALPGRVVECVLY